MLTDFLVVYTFLPVRYHDKIRRLGVDYEVADYEVAEVGLFRFQGEPLYFRSVCRRLPWLVAIEDPVTTLVRLLKTEMWLVKDDGSLASIHVGKEWFNREPLKNYEGQVTVGLARSDDQKLGLSTKVCRRLGILRVNIWVIDKPNMVGRLGYIHVFQDSEDQQLQRIIKFCKAEAFIKILGNIPDEQFFQS